MHILFATLLCFSIPKTGGLSDSSKYVMIVTWGQPGTFSGYTDLSASTSSWGSCVDYCYQLATCVTIYNSSTGCQMFEIGQISTISQLDESSGTRIAFKIKSNETTCASSVDSVGNVMNGDVLTDNSTYQKYTVTFDSGTFTFETTGKVVCPQNFFIFIRPLRPWCIRVVKGATCLTKTQSSGNCSSLYGGQLSGLQDDTEADFVYVSASGKSLVAAQSKYKLYGVWLDGTRITSCMNSGTFKPSWPCNTTAAFEFTDPLMSTPGGYNFIGGQPSGLNANPTYENCLNFRIDPDSTGVDDVNCTLTISAKTEICMAAYACGLRPSSARNVPNKEEFRFKRSVSFCARRSRPT